MNPKPGRGKERPYVPTAGTTVLFISELPVHGLVDWTSTVGFVSPNSGPFKKDFAFCVYAPRLSNSFFFSSESADNIPLILDRKSTNGTRVQKFEQVLPKGFVNHKKSGIESSLLDTLTGSE